MEGFFIFVMIILCALVACYWLDSFESIDKNTNFSPNHKYFPENRVELVCLLRNESILLNEINTSKVIDMSFLFCNVEGESLNIFQEFGDRASFNLQNNAGTRKNFAGIETWDTSNVEDMTGMFAMQTTFNQDISRWNTSKVKSMAGMFFYARSFNASIGSWNVSNVLNMTAMFLFAVSFNQDISQWNAENVRDMGNMFAYALAFDKFQGVLQSGLMGKYGSGIKRTGMFSGVKGADVFLREVIAEYLSVSRQYQNLTQEDIQGLERYVQDLTTI
ncbi:BspA family leucine-rich repeat surface protein [Helicobacter sp.]|uniref:BspA family leucine-rich repeat surface protein n=1 Tax=Helicobacter sp. TaxID=218 RepID=UPI001989DF2A|nr:BspA family leucine-rich repeat surface protein [Helicobacter sp.]MBD5164479.1 BspA family leucine-rich repeat surface protein [Helicobacter sp.]